MDSAGDSFGCFLSLFNVCLFLFFGTGIYNYIGIVIFPWIIAWGGALGVCRCLLLTSALWGSTTSAAGLAGLLLLLGYGLYGRKILIAHINRTSIAQLDATPTFRFGSCYCSACTGCAISFV